MLELDEFYPKFFDSIPASVILLDSTDTIILTNETTETISGYSKEDLLGKKLSESKFFPKKFSVLLQEMKGAILNGETLEPVEIQAYKKDGEAIWLLLHLSSLQLTSKEFFQVYSWDITARKEKQAEEDFERIFNLTPDMVAVGTTEGKFLKVNPSWEKVLGYTNQELLDMGWNKLVHPDDVERTNKEIEMQLKGSPVMNFINRYRCKDGSYRTFEWQATFAKEGIIHATARDITERKQAEDKLRESEEKWRSLTENSPDYIMLLDRDGKIQFINRTLPDLTREQVIGASIYDFTSFENMDAFKETLERVLETGKPDSYEAVRKNEGETEQYFESQIVPIIKEKKVVGLIIRSVDITERKRAEEALQASEEKFAKAFYSAPNLMAITRMTDGLIFDVNESFVKIMGYSLEELIGRTTTELNLWAHPEQRELAKKSFQEHNYVHNFEVEVRTKSGESRIMLLSSEIMGVYEEAPYLITTANDITERKEIEKTLSHERDLMQALFENHPDFFYFKDSEARFHRVSKRFCDIFGLSMEDIIGKTDLELFPEEVAEQTYSEDLHVIKTGTPIVNKEENVGELWVLTTKIPWFGKKGNIIGLFGISRDISKLKELDRLKDEFYADLSHELRTPLVSIRGFSELLLRSTNLDPIQRQDVDTILRNETRLERLVIELMEFSRLKSGKIKFKKDTFRASEILQELTTELEPMIDEQEVKIKTEFSSDEAVVFDRYQITKVIKNFLTNAIKYSSAGGLIEIKSIIGDGEWIFSVQDHGIGIAAEDLPKIFSRFIRLKRTRELDTGGIGLGLAIRKKIIEAQDGKIWAESLEINRGSTFIFQLTLTD